jgi:hypothetical protein
MNTQISKQKDKQMHFAMLCIFVIERLREQLTFEGLLMASDCALGLPRWLIPDEGSLLQFVHDFLDIALVGDEGREPPSRPSQLKHPRVIAWFRGWLARSRRIRASQGKARLNSEPTSESPTIR